jgi:hypothetical protein
MSGYDMRPAEDQPDPGPGELDYAAARRDEGLRTVSRFTWRVGAAGVVCSALIGVGFGINADASGARGQQTGIVVPNQPPGPAHGSGQVTSGAT